VEKNGLLFMIKKWKGLNVLKNICLKEKNTITEIIIIIIKHLFTYVKKADTWLFFCHLVFDFQPLNS